jgi:hypothetical protein
VIVAVNPTFTPAWPSGWEDVEVVDSVLVPEPGAAPEPPVAANVYDGSGRVAPQGRFGRLVSVLA